MRRIIIGQTLWEGLLWAALACMALSLTSCYEAKSHTCASGLVCPSATKCSADGKACLTDADTCGDGVIQKGELCDDGNISGGDGCSADCLSLERCGDGVTDKAVGEACDDENTVSGDGCSEDCRSTEVCGNRILDKAVGEVCDDGNTSGKDGCSDDCRSDETCGNGVRDVEVAEVCDDGNNLNGDDCTADCKEGGVCGNGVQEAGEECDDGNLEDADFCSNKCRAPRCGDGRVYALREQCDEGGETAQCNLNCTTPRCGDGIVNHHAGEQCDVGGQPSVACKDCKVSFCGDRVIDSALGEQCDEGPGGGNGCSAKCKRSVCGNGKVEDGEACDDGNVNSCGTCSATCTEAWPSKNSEGHIKFLGTVTNIVDGWKFVVGVGDEIPVVFELNRTGGVGEGNVEIKLNGNDSAETVVGTIREKLHEWRVGTGVDADLISVDGAVSYIKLKSRKAGAVGNQRIGRPTTDLFSNAFEVVGLSGGAAKDCAKGTGCSTDLDCSEGLSCENKRCDD
jgi:cysteine-rich repeat protein